MKASEQIQDYFDSLKEKTSKAYDAAEKARAKGLDPSTEVEIPIAKGVGGRVEKLIEEEGLAERITQLMEENSREETALKLIKFIIDKTDDREEGIEIALRAALALYTEGVVAAPIEGISDINIEENPDGSEHLSIYFSGPIRSAGGTAQAVTMLFADYARQLIDLEEYRPTKTEVERYVEEIEMYDQQVARLQYTPSEKEIRQIVNNCPVCVTGGPTTQMEVQIHKDLDRVDTNCVRGGMCLVIGEGIAQKAKKVQRYAKEFGLDWSWLQALIKVEKASSSSEEEKKKKIEPSFKYLRDVVAGRPVFSYPSREGGFRLRYGRSRNNGLMAKGVHPASMYILGKFPAIGTQLKVERPGKGMVVVPCDSIEGPVVRLADGSVERVESVERAKEIERKVKEVLFLGDLLVSFGDFLHSNHSIVPSGYVEEWWEKELDEQGGEVDDAWNVTAEQAIQLSEEYDVPLHPKYTPPFDDVKVKELKKLIKWLDSERKNSEEKRTLEKLFIPHETKENKIVIPEDWEHVLKKVLNYEKTAEIVDRLQPESAMELVEEVSNIKIREKAPVYVGTRMGRPEKAKERHMQPSPHILFPVGNYGGNTRSLLKATRKKNISVDLARMKCPSCGKIVAAYKCPNCDERTEVIKVCPKCGTEAEEKCPKCGKWVSGYERRTINIKKLMRSAKKNVGSPQDNLKGVKMTMSRNRCFEPLEKGIIRSRHDVHIFKDATSRFDATNLPLTHFKPGEIGTSVEKLRELGYTKDVDGNELKEPEQVVELKPQDVVLPKEAGEHLQKVAGFVDELLDRFYDQEMFFEADSREDLIGELLIFLAPHTSAGVLGRVIGFSTVRGLYAHPYFVAASRRDCDGDENAVMLLMDGLLNFSKSYLPSSRGGKMDAPLVLTQILDPSEVDDQAHELETIDEMPLWFFKESMKFKKPKEIDLDIVEQRLGEENQYDGFGFTHSVSDISEGVTQSSYTSLGDMKEKVNAQLGLGRRIRCVDEKDVASRLLDCHFMRDIYGNLRAFGEQQFRCVDCNKKYRRFPLPGECNNCGGRVILTISKGSVEKYLKISKEIARKYGLSDYMKQRLELVGDEIESVFVNEKSKQYDLTEFF